VKEPPVAVNVVELPEQIVVVPVMPDGAVTDVNVETAEMLPMIMFCVPGSEAL